MAENDQEKSGDRIEPPPHLDPETGLSNAPVHEITLESGEVMRIDNYGRILCTARRRGDGQKCKSPAVSGHKVCRNHGARSPQARRAAQLRLAELVQPGIATLAREMTQADKSADRQRAANSILDRAGISRVQKIESSDARDLLYERLIALRERDGDIIGNDEEMDI